MNYWNLLQTKYKAEPELMPLVEEVVKLSEFQETFTKVAKAFDMSEEEIKLSLEEFNNERPRA